MKNIRTVVFALLFLASIQPAALYAATPTLGLTPEDLVSLINQIAEASRSWPMQGNGKVQIPAPNYSAARGGGKNFSVQVNPLVAITGITDAHNGEIRAYGLDLLLTDDKAIAQLRNSDTTNQPSQTKLFGNTYSALFAALLILNSSTEEEFTRICDTSKKFFETGGAKISKSDTVRLNRHVSLKFTYTNKRDAPYLLYRMQVVPNK